MLFNTNEQCDTVTHCCSHDGEDAKIEPEVELTDKHARGSAQVHLGSQKGPCLADGAHSSQKWNLHRHVDFSLLLVF